MFSNSIRPKECSHKIKFSNSHCLKNQCKNRNVCFQSRFLNGTTFGAWYGRTAVAAAPARHPTTAPGTPAYNQPKAAPSPAPPIIIFPVIFGHLPSEFPCGLNLDESVILPMDWNEICRTFLDLFIFFHLSYSSANFSFNLERWVPNDSPSSIFFKSNYYNVWKES